MKTEHTPGPWKPRDYTNNEGDIWIDCDAFKPGKRGKCIGGTVAIALHTGTGPGTMEGNARLIAAAPELLEALRGLCDVNMQDSLHKGGVYLRNYAAARDAIAKATGGQS